MNAVGDGRAFRYATASEPHPLDIDIVALLLERSRHLVGETAGRAVSVEVAGDTPIYVGCTDAAFTMLVLARRQLRQDFLDNFFVVVHLYFVLWNFDHNFLIVRICGAKLRWFAILVNGLLCTFSKIFAHYCLQKWNFIRNFAHIFHVCVHNAHAKSRKMTTTHKPIIKARNISELPRSV